MPDGLAPFGKTLINLNTLEWLALASRIFGSELKDVSRKKIEFCWMNIFMLEAGFYFFMNGVFKNCFFFKLKIKKLIFFQTLDFCISIPSLIEKIIVVIF